MRKATLRPPLILLGAVILAAIVFGAHSNAYAALKDNVIFSTMGENIHGVGEVQIDSKSVFTSQSKEIIWFCKFKLWSASSEAGLRIQWIAPGGIVFKESRFKPFYWNISFAWAKLDIQGEDRNALAHEGEWTAKVYWDHELIDERVFRIGYPKPIPQPVEDPVPTPVVATAEGSMRLAKVHVSKGEYSKAIVELRRAQALDPDSPTPYMVMGSIYNATKRPEEAVQQFTLAQSKGADPVKTHRGLAKAFQLMGAPDEAIAEYEKLLVLEPDSEEDRAALQVIKTNPLPTTQGAAESSATERENQEFDEVKLGELRLPVIARSAAGSIVIFNKSYMIIAASEKDPKVSDLIDACGLYRPQDNLFAEQEKALIIYKNCLEKHPENGKLRRAAGLMSLAIGQSEAALAHLKEAVALLPGDPLSRFALGDAHFLSDMRTEAEAMYQEALTLGHPDPAFINNNRLAALRSAVSAWEMEAKIRAYTGLTIEDGIVSELLYRDSVKRAVASDFYYRREGVPLHPMAVIDSREVLSKHSGMKRLEAHLETVKNTYRQAKAALDSQRRTATGNEKTAIEHKLMRLIAENESLFLIAKNQYTKQIEEALRKIARQYAVDQGYNAVVRRVLSARKGAVDPVNITASALRELEASPVTSEDLDLALQSAKNSIRLVEKNLKSEILLKN